MPTTSQLCSPLSLRSSLSVPADLPTVEGASQGVGSLSSSSPPSRGTGPILLPLFFPFVQPSYVEIFLTLSGV